MYRLSKEATFTLTVKKSEFIAILLRVESEEEVKAFLKVIRKSHPKARHVCHAVIIHGDHRIERSNDDGEPAGTAGLPMLEILRKRNIENVLAVVVRYFGGILLGSGGLIRAYSKSVTECLDHAKLSEVQEVLKTTFRFPIRFADAILSHLKETTILSKEFGEKVTITILSDDDAWLESCRSISGGLVDIISQERILIETPISAQE